MSAYLKKGITVWILGFLTILAFLNAFNAAMRWTLNGSNHEFEPYLIGQFTGRIQVTLYFWISVATTFVFLGCTIVMAFRKPPIDPALVEKFDNMNDQLATNKTALQEGLETSHGFIRTIKTDLLERIEAQKRVNEKSFETLGANLRSIKNETLDALEKGFQGVSRELSSAIETSVSGVRGKVFRALAKQEEVIRRVEHSSKKSIKTIEKVTADLDEMKTRLETLETALALPQPKLTSHSGPRDIIGIGPRLAEELKAMGITNVGEFLTADPAAIDKKTRLTQETAERFQGAAQLLMVPGIDKTDVELLEKVGVANRTELGKWEPFELYRKLSEFAKTHVKARKISEADRPTVEDVLSWVKLAKS